MDNNSLHPQLRYIEAYPIEQDDQVVILIRDPLEFSPGPLIMSPAEFFLVSHFDGQHSLSDIKIKFAERFDGVLLPEGHLEKLVQILDENFYLNSPAFLEHQQRTMREFAESPLRRAWHAGSGYSDNPETLRYQLDGFYRDPGGAGAIQSYADGQPADSICPTYIVPHIDLRVGGAAYTHVFRHLAEHYRPEVVVILGVAHYGGEHFFNATRKDFETPLGQVQTDQAFLDRWHARAGDELFAQEWVHRTEHSVEFQLPFLQHALSHEFQIVPVLVGSLELHLKGESRPGQLGAIDDVIDTLKETLREEQRKVALLLSVDLAHMGPKFGDEEPIDDLRAAAIKTADQRLFDVLNEWDLERYWELMRSDLLPRKVDACAAIYALLRMFDKGKSRMLCYDQNMQPDTGSIVTFASLALQPQRFRE